jgi:hypothetical protein
MCASGFHLEMRKKQSKPKQRAVSERVAGGVGTDSAGPLALARALALTLPLALAHCYWHSRRRQLPLAVTAQEPTGRAQKVQVLLVPSSRLPSCCLNAKALTHAYQ